MPASIDDRSFDDHDASLTILRRCVPWAAQQADWVAPIIASFLRMLPPSRLGLYGTGALSRQLVLDHQASLSRHEVLFIETSPDSVEFLGYPKVCVRSLADHLPEHVIVMSSQYEAEMLTALELFKLSTITTLAEACDRAERRVRQKFLQELLITEKRRWYTAQINAAGGEQKKVIAMVTPILNIKHLKLMRTLKESGFCIILITEKEYINQDFGFHLNDFRKQGYFDLSFTSHHSFDSMATDILKTGRIYIAHLITSTAGTQKLANIVASAECPVIVDYDDFIELDLPDDSQYQKYISIPDSEMSKERLAFQTLFCQSSGIIQRHSPELVKLLARKYERTPRWLHFGPYPSERLFSGKAKAPRLPKDPIRIVFASGVQNDPKANNYVLFQSLFRAARLLAEQGIEFTIFNGLDRTGEGFEDVIELSRSIPLFHYHFALPYDQLVERLIEYDWGWHCMDFSHGAGSATYYTRGLSSKFYTYLEAGLPIIISKALTYECSLIERDGLGIGITYEDVSRVGQILCSTDHESLCKRVLAYRQHWSLEAQVYRLVMFYREMQEVHS